MLNYNRVLFNYFPWQPACIIEIKCVSLVCQNNGRQKTALFATSAIQRSFNSLHSIGSHRHNAPHTLNSPNENRYCSIRHCSKTAWISIICFQSCVENSLLDQTTKKAKDFKIFTRNSSLAKFCRTRAFSAISRVSFPSRDSKKCQFLCQWILVVEVDHNGYGSECSE